MVKAKGSGVSNGINIEDKVYGVTLPQQGGCHAEYVVVDQILVRSQFDLPLLVHTQTQFTVTSQT